MSSRPEKTDASSRTIYANNDQKPLSARRTDFKIGIVLLSVCSLLFFHTLSFPMSGSYAGVENQWYVSPALFPLLVLSVLILSALVLLFCSFKSKGHTNFFFILGWVGDLSQREARDKWFVILLTCAYVFIYIPCIDFYIATTLFVFSLVARFYFDPADGLPSENTNLLALNEKDLSPYVLKQNLKRVRKKEFYIAFPAILIFLVHFTLLTLLVFVKAKIQPEAGFFQYNPVSDESLIRSNDIAASIVLIIFFFVFHINRKHNLNKYVVTFVTCFVVPLLLIIIFNFFLYVPMPVEYGSVMNFLNFVAFDLLRLH